MQYSLLIGRRKYNYQLLPEKEDGISVTRVICESANIDQTFLNEDIPALLLDLPNLILDEEVFQKSKKAQRSTYIRVRVSEEEKRKIKKNSLAKGFKNTSEFIRSMVTA